MEVPGQVYRPPSSPLSMYRVRDEATPSRTAALLCPAFRCPSGPRVALAPPPLRSDGEKGAPTLVSSSDRLRGTWGARGFVVHTPTKGKRCGVGKDYGNRDGSGDGGKGVVL